MPRHRGQNDEAPPQFFIGPETHSDPGRLLDEARQRVREDDEYNRESSKLARRLLIAFVLIVLLGIGFYIVLPHYGLRLPPLVPMLCFGAIAIGALLNTGEPGSDDAAHDADDPDGCADGGCAVGMCPGPRPLRMFRDDDKDDREPRR